MAKQKAETIKFDPEDLTIGDLEDFQEVTGKEFFEVLEGDSEDGVQFTAKELKALVWIVKRQENPEFSLDDARDVKVGALDFGDEDDDDDGDDEGDNDPSQ